MPINLYDAQWYMDERVKDAHNEAERSRLSRVATGLRGQRGERGLVRWIRKSLLSLSSGNSLPEPCNQSLRNAPSSTGEACCDCAA